MDGSPPDSLPPVERALRGSFDDLKAYLEDIRRANWPDLRLFVYDADRARAGPEPKIVTREVDGKEVPINWPPGHDMRRLEKSVEGLVNEAVREQPALEFIRQGLPYVLTIHDTNTRERRLMGEVFSGLENVHGAAIPFAAPNTGMVVSVGIAGSVCRHCAGPPTLDPEDCQQTSPDQARFGQLSRLVIAYHEMGHALDFDSGINPVGKAIKEISEAVRDDKAGIDPGKVDKAREYEGNTGEGLADSFAALMMIRDLGPEGRAMVELWGNARSNPLLGVEHLTAPILRATLDWADANPHKLAGLTPRQIFDESAGIALASGSYGTETMLLHGYLRDQVLGSPQDTQEQEFARARAFREPDAVRGRIREMEQNPGKFPDVAERYERHQLWFLERREDARATLSAHNPLNQSDWDEKERARSGTCRASIDAAQLEAARGKLAELLSQPTGNEPTLRPPAAPDNGPASGL